MRRLASWDGRETGAKVYSFVVAAKRVGDGVDKLLVALPACHLDRGGPNGRGWEDAAAPDLVLFKTGGRGGGRKRGRGTDLPVIYDPSFAFSSRPSVSVVVVAPASSGCIGGRVGAAGGAVGTEAHS